MLNMKFTFLFQGVSPSDVLNFHNQVGHWFGKGCVGIDPAGIWLNCCLPRPVDFEIAPEILECCFFPVGSKYLWNLLNVPFTCTADGRRMSICFSYLLLVNFHWQACMTNVYAVVIWMDNSVTPYDRHIGFKGQKLLLNFLCEFSLQTCKSSNWMFGKAKIKVLNITLLGLLMFIVKSFIYCYFALNSVYNHEC